MKTNIYERLPGLAANARNFVTQLDAPTLHDRLNKLATACDQAHAEITTLRAQVAEVRKDWVLAPREPTDEMWKGLARDLIMAWEMASGPTIKGTRDHLRMIGTAIPDWLEKEFGDKVHLSKSDRAVLIYKAMIATIPTTTP